MVNNYRKNLAALRQADSDLWDKLQKIEGNDRFEVFAGSDPIDINILDRDANIPFYDSPVGDTEEKLKELAPNMARPFLCFFGIGNGILFKALLGNRSFNHIFVFEPEIELIYVALHINDFSQDIGAQRLIIVDANKVDFVKAMQLLKLDDMLVYLKLYDLIITQPIYARYHSTIEKINQFMIDAIVQIVKTHGNDLEDALIGVDHFLQNADAMIENAAFIDMRDQKNSDLAITVATGPSLTKQLPLLKEIQDYATIISVDASLPILEKHGIIPDIVTSLERVELTAKFYENTSEEFQKQIGCFAISALAHKRLIESVKGTRCLIMRPFGYMMVFGLNRHGYAGIGMSAANLAYELAFLLGYKQTALIGQDLAYSIDGKTTHAGDHIFGDRDPSVVKHMDSEEKIYFPAWGAKGKIRSNSTWALFRNFFIQNISDAKHRMATYNCTEGGCHIDGAIDRPFAEVVAEFVDRSKVKKRIVLPPADAKTVKKEKAQVRSVIKTMIKTGRKALDTIIPLQKATVKLTTKLEKKSRDDQIKEGDFAAIASINARIDKAKKILEDSLFMKYYWDALRSMVVNMELNIAKITTKIPTNETEQKDKHLDYLFAHRFWLFSVKGAIETQLKILAKYDGSQPRSAKPKAALKETS
ncbi:MAG: DUF115 domain-containing protein [Helicobacteraceae bacterium]|jgi:hypothetical protein|nr:DUF115 domain-containing protein [Helicobacteraceae bacterium]